MTDQPKSIVLKPVDKMMTYIDAQRPNIEKILPKHMSVERFVTQARLALGKNERLVRCTPLSVVKCIMDAAELGLDPTGRLGSAYLVPFKDVCTLIPGYRGLIDLAARSGQVKSIEAFVVHERDEFTYQAGKIPTHRPYLPRIDEEQDPGRVWCAWAVAAMRGGRQAVVMTLKELEAIRARSPSVRKGQSSPWDSDREEMQKKTVIRRLVKLLPLSPERARDLARAIELDPDDEERLVNPESEPPEAKKSVSAGLAERLSSRPQEAEFAEHMDVDEYRSPEPPDGQ